MGLKEKKWQGYRGTGFVAKLGKHHLALREGLGSSKEFAIILVKGDLFESTPIKVLEEFRARNLEEAWIFFDRYTKKLRAKPLPRRMPEDFPVGGLISH